MWNEFLLYNIVEKYFSISYSNLADPLIYCYCKQEQATDKKGDGYESKVLDLSAKVQTCQETGY